MAELRPSGRPPCPVKDLPAGGTPTLGRPSPVALEGTTPANDC